jgi:amidase
VLGYRLRIAKRVGLKTTRRDLLKVFSTGVTVVAVGSPLLGCSPSDGATGLIKQPSTSGVALMTDQPIHYKTLSEVATLIAQGDLDSIDVTEALLARIDQLEPRLHAYISVMKDQAMATAAESDALRNKGHVLGPLHGVPIAVKDLCHKTGWVTTGGHSFRKDAVADADATVVARLEAAGAILLGKLATTEGAMVGYHRDFEVPRNPWGDLDRWPGVSSGGSGVATAAGLCFASLGTDTGGSIRFPSAVNGIVGLKPTWGRVSRHGVLDLAPTLDHVGPMTRSVRDAARVLGVIAGHDLADPTTLHGDVPDYEAEMEKGVSGLRIGWDEAFATKDVEPYVAEAVTEAVALLAELGADVVNIKVPELSEDELAAWGIIAASEAAAVHEATYPSQADAYGAYFNEFLQQGRDTSSVDLAKANFARRRAVGRMAPVFQGIDVLACPTLASEAFRYSPEGAYGGLDTDKGTIGGVPLSWFPRSARFVTVWDYNGYPTLSLPCGFSPDQIPLSLELIAQPLNEALLLRAGHSFEQACDFSTRHPLLG